MKRMIFILLMLIPTLTVAQREWTSAKDQYGQEIKIIANEKTGAPHRIYGFEDNLKQAGNITENNVQGISRSFLNKYSEILKISSSSVKFINAETNKGKWFVTFQQFYKSVPVDGALVSFTVNENGRVIMAGSDVHFQIEVGHTPQITSEEAIEFAQQSFYQLSGMDYGNSEIEPELIVLPVETEQSYDYFLTWKLKLNNDGSSNTYFNETYFVDANNGTKVFQYSNIKNVVGGTVQLQYWPDSHNDALSTGIYKYGSVKFYNSIGQTFGEIYTDSNGFYSTSSTVYGVYSKIKGQYAILKNKDESHSYGITSGVHNWTFAGSDATNVFYHNNLIHDFFVGAPFYYTTMNFQMNYWFLDEQDLNARAENGNKISFGTQNGEYYPRARDVIYHEYTHNVIYHLYGGSFIGTSGQAFAMDEGLSDYYACSLTNDSYHSESVGGTRNLNNTFVWDTGENQHWNGQVIGGACWDLRSLISTSYVDELVFDALQMTPHAYDFEDFALNIALADDNDGNLNNSVPHFLEIQEAFETNHGISVYAIPGYIATIDGDLAVEEYNSGSWTASVINGTAPYSYQWYYKEDGDVSWNTGGTSSSYSRSVGPVGFFDLKCVVTDANSNTDDAFFDVVVESESGGDQKISTGSIPKDFALSQNYPNPFNPVTSIKYALPGSQYVTLRVYNITGQLVATLVNESKSAGFHDVQWDASNMASGVYIYTISAGSFSETKKMVVMK